MQIINPDGADVSLPLTELAKIPVPEVFGPRAHEAAPLRLIPHMHGQAAAQQPDPVVQSALGSANIPTPTTTFEGMGAGLAGFTVNTAPPDTDGDIGPNHYVQIVNSGVTIFNKAGTKLFGPVNTNTIWANFAAGTACQNTNDGDGTVRYDRIADRWVISQFSVNGGNGPFFQCIAVSTSPDPTGTYTRYQFSFNAFNDYPKMGLWPDAYYFTYNLFPNNVFGGARVCAVDRVKMIAGNLNATQQCFDTGTNFGALLASDVDGPTLPPAGEPNLLVALDTTALDFFKFHVDFTTPANSTFSGSTPTTIPVAAYTPLCNGGTCVVQPGTTQRLDSLADRLMNRLVYRNFGDHEALLVSHAVTAGTGGGVRFYELRLSAACTATNCATPTIFQQGTFAPDASFRWMSSMAFDLSGNIAMGYSVSSSTINPSIRYTGRLTTDALGTIGQGEATLIAGTGSQTGNQLSRWGDYSSMNIDPSDDCTFWYTQEYMAATGSFNWHTRIGNFKFANCPPNDFSIMPSSTSQTVGANSSTTYTINTTVVSGIAETIALSVTGLPAGVTGTFNPTSVTAGGNSTLTVTVPAGTAASTSTLTIIGTAPSKIHTTTASLTITIQPPTVTLTAPTNGSTINGPTVTVSATATDSDGSVTNVKFDLPDGTSVTDNGSPYSTTFDSTKVANGNYTIKATATDNQGANAVATVTITVHNNVGPTVSITAPTNGSTISGTSVPVSAIATDSDGTVMNVKFDLPDGTSVTDTTTPYSITFDTTKVANGSYMIKATATDNQSATSNVATVTITVYNNVPPTVSIASPTDNSTVSGTVTVVANATDSDGSINNVTFDLPDGTSVAATTAPFSAVFDSTKVANGSHTINATATDNQGATNAASVTITVTNCLSNPISAMDVPIAIPDNDPIGITSSIPVAGNGTIASLSLSLDIAHPFRGDLSVILISPGGSRFNVSNRLGGSSDNISFADLSISAFNGQVAAGTWKLQVQDLEPGHRGMLNSWTLTIGGKCTPTTHWSSSATLNLSTKDNGMVCTSLVVATAGGDSSVAKLDIAGRHDFRSSLRGTLAHNGITVDAFPIDTFPTGSGTFNFTNRAVPGLSSDSVGAWTFCILDTDAFNDTGVLNAWSVHD